MNITDYMVGWGREAWPLLQGGIIIVPGERYYGTTEEKWQVDQKTLSE